MDPDTNPQETPVDDRGVRSEAANNEIRKILHKYNCVIVVESLNIQTGKILPKVVIAAK